MFECHVTVRPPKDEPQEKWYDHLAEEYNWKRSQIDGDPVLGDRVFAYFTTHSPDLDWIRNKMDHLVEELGDSGDFVLRTKIEYIVQDSRFPDG